jgi:hypothetical protein
MMPFVQKPKLSEEAKKVFEKIKVVIDARRDEEGKRDTIAIQVLYDDLDDKTKAARRIVTGALVYFSYLALNLLNSVTKLGDKYPMEVTVRMSKDIKRDFDEYAKQQLPFSL